MEKDLVLMLINKKKVNLPDNKQPTSTCDTAKANKMFQFFLQNALSRDCVVNNYDTFLKEIESELQSYLRKFVKSFKQH